MPVHNAEISRIFNEVADLLEIEGANEFRVRAYRDAARTIDGYPRTMADMLEEGKDLTELPGIGQDLAGKIEEIVDTGGLAQLDEVRSRTPPELADLLDVAGLGPKRVATLHRKLGVTTEADLRQAAEEGRIRELHGFGERIEQKVLGDLKHRQGQEARTRLDVAEDAARPLVRYLGAGEDVERVQVAGSYRRRKETVGDLDILAISQSGQKVIQRFVEYENVAQIVSQGETRSSVILRSGLQVDLRVVEAGSCGAALFYFTGSKAHNIAIRNMAVDRGLKVNEYGVFEGEEQIAGETEEEIYDLFDLPTIAPELREDRGEIAAARQGQLPDLVRLDDVRGDLQCHTTASDGRSSLEEMARAAQDMGHDYLAITDHSPLIGVTQGLDAEELAQRIDTIRRLDEEVKGIRLLAGIEVDILEDGSLDLPDDVLEKLDLVICAAHSKFDLSVGKQTERIIRAMDNPNVNILAHPTGRRIGKRPGYNVDLERVMEVALERGCFLEINAQPERLDLDDVHAKMAQEMGLKLAISTDAHSTSELRYLRFGVYQARRGWLEPDDVLNTRSWEDLSTLLKR
ncbi:MAG: DNA polymerase/3'-5' exonuclease PolX [Anaerolineae bacterium]|jgi:DNA polymerase (family 10)